ncbi:MAG: hypothetical protein R2717_01105 [Schumannella sp.]
MTAFRGALSYYDAADVVIPLLFAGVTALGGIGFAFITASNQRRELRNENVILEPPP